MTNIFNCTQFKVNSVRSSYNFTKLLLPNHAEYKGESVNKSQMYIKRKTCDITTWKKTFISRHILFQHWYTCSIILSMHWNPKHRSLLTVVSATSTPPFQPLCHQQNIWLPVVNCFTWQTLHTINRKHFFKSILCTESFCPQKKKRTLLFGSTPLKHSRHFDYWNNPVNMRMHLCYLGCHEGGLCCYLVIHRENLLHPLQLIYFHLWPIYWLSLIIYKICMPRWKCKTSQLHGKLSDEAKDYS
jgi:hypothetical protein